MVSRSSVRTVGVHVLAVYRPNPGGEAALQAEVVAHVPLLRRLGLATDFASHVLRAADGTLVEHFEWVSHEAIGAAHQLPDVLAMWQRFDECATTGPWPTSPNATTLFPELEHLGSY